MPTLVEYFYSELIAERLQFLDMELVGVFREALERTRPVGLTVVDPPAAIVALARDGGLAS